MRQIIFAALLGALVGIILKNLNAPLGDFLLAGAFCGALTQIGKIGK